LNIRLSATQLQIIVDINTARPDINNYGIDAVYTLTEIATGKPVTKGQTFARVSYNIPGQEQRFAGERGLRDAEDRAAKEISENIRNRLASHFAAGT
jgi:LPS-assembly lipoprotein